MRSEELSDVERARKKKKIQKLQNSVIAGPK